jgi:hypothetical protein
MPINDFKPFATGLGANVIPQADYASTSYDSLRNNGFTTGTAQSVQLNKVWRQASFISAAIGEMIKENGDDALDDGDLAAMVIKLKASILGVIPDAPTTTEDTKWEMMPVGVPTPFVESVVGESVATWLVTHTNWQLLTDVLPGSGDKAMVIAGTSVAESTFGSADAITVAHTHAVNDHGHSINDPSHAHNLTAHSRLMDGTGTEFDQTIRTDEPAIGGYIAGAITGITINNATGVTTQSTGASGTNANIPPSIALVWIIKTS